MTANEWIEQRLGDDLKPSDAVTQIIRDAFNDGVVVGNAKANHTWAAKAGERSARLTAEVTRLTDRVRALKHENNKLRKELWQRKESK